MPRPMGIRMKLPTPSPTGSLGTMGSNNDNNDNNQQELCGTGRELGDIKPCFPTTKTEIDIKYDKIKIISDSNEIIREYSNLQNNDLENLKNNYDWTGNKKEGVQDVFGRKGSHKYLFYDTQNKYVIKQYYIPKEEKTVKENKIEKEILLQIYAHKLVDTFEIPGVTIKIPKVRSWWKIDNGYFCIMSIVMENIPKTGDILSDKIDTIKHINKIFKKNKLHHNDIFEPLNPNKIKSGNVYLTNSNKIAIIDFGEATIGESEELKNLRLIQSFEIPTTISRSKSKSRSRSKSISRSRRKESKSISRTRSIRRSNSKTINNTKKSKKTKKTKKSKKKKAEKKNQTKRRRK